MNAPQSESSRSPQPDVWSVRFGWIACAIVLVLWGLNLYLFFRLSPNFDWKAGVGQLGDVFGVVNALFSGLAFAGLFTAILLQRSDLNLQAKNLSLQIEELRETRTELANQNVHFDAQNRVLKKQSFEATFFQTLSLLRDLKVPSDHWGQMLEGVRHKQSEIEVKKHGHWELDVQSFLFHGAMSWAPDASKDEVISRQRTLYYILKLIDDSEVVEKQFYARIVAALICEGELIVLYYACASLEGRLLRDLAIKYRLFRNLRFCRLASTEHAKLLGDAFGSDDADNRSIG